jgi:Lrp/AsnC family leucine-responsive transcriptional regulator
MKNQSPPQVSQLIAERLDHFRHKFAQVYRKIALYVIIMNLNSMYSRPDNVKMELSQIERTILRMLQVNSRTKLEDIAIEAGASIPTIQRKIRHFRNTGIIRGEMVELDPEAVGLQMTFLILVELERERVQHLDAFRTKMRSEPQIQQCYYITGEADFALIALAKDMKEYQALIQRLFFDDMNVKRFRTSVVMDSTKTGLTVPI